jgi:cytochrome c oxidase cbb3-type subunit 3
LRGGACCVSGPLLEIFFDRAKRSGKTCCFVAKAEPALMHYSQLMRFAHACVLLLSGFAPLAAFGQTQASQLPEGPYRETVQRICSGCHSVQMFSGREMTREQWGGVVSNMIGRGAKLSDQEFDEVVNYLAQTLPPGNHGPTTTGAAKAAPVHKQSLIDQAGADDKQVVDEEAAARGKTVYIAQCITCHGTRARGGERGADLVRSLVVLHDRYGSTLGPYLAEGHPAVNPVALTPDQIVDLSHFLHQQVGDTLRTGPYNNVLDILVGDPTAGKAFFYGAGRCSQCHSATGDLAHIAGKYDPPSLQLKVVFPQDRAVARTGPATPRQPLTVTVTTPSGESVTGVPTELDDFNVSLRDASGQYHSFARGPGVKVEKHDPYAAHVALLDQYTDKEIHDVVAYLETLQ